MREIKFKAWHKKRKRWYNVFHWNKGDTVDSITNLCGFNRVETLFVGEDIELVQYTGLHDKNGKEIYEGDIVQFYFCADHPLATSPKKDKDITEMVDEVKFKEGAFFFCTPDVGDCAHARRFNRRCEVIGNIYENPEKISNQRL